MLLAQLCLCLVSGVTAVNPRVNIPDFFSRYVVPELSAADVNDRPILKVGAHVRRSPMVSVASPMGAFAGRLHQVFVDVPEPIGPWDAS